MDQDSMKLRLCRTLLTGNMLDYVDFRTQTCRIDTTQGVVFSTFRWSSWRESSNLFSNHAIGMWGLRGSRGLPGAPWGSLGLPGRPGEPQGARGNPREPRGAPGSPWERLGAPGNPREPWGAPGDDPWGPMERRMPERTRKRIFVNCQNFGPIWAPDSSSA